MKATLPYVEMRTSRAQRCHRLVLPLLWAACSVLCVALFHVNARAAAKKNPALQASSSRALQLKVAKSIPYQKMKANDRARVAAVVNRPSIYRRLPTAVIDCNPTMFQNIVTNPEILVGVWEVMGISKVKMTRVSPGVYQADDGDGTTCTMKYVYSSGPTQIIYAQGRYKGTMAPKTIKGSCVIVLQSGAVLETNGRHYVTTRMDCYMQLDQFGVELLAKVFKSMIFKSADFNFTESAKFISRLSRSAEVNPIGMHKLAKKLTKLKPEVLASYSKVIDNVHLESVKRIELARRANLRKQQSALEKSRLKKVNSIRSSRRDTKGAAATPSVSKTSNSTSTKQSTTPRPNTTRRTTYRR